MIKFIDKLREDAQAHLFLLESFATPPEGYKDSTEKRNMRMSALGEGYLCYKTLDKIHTSLNNIKKYALSEINGTYYNDHLKEYEGTDLETEYTSDSVYQSIEGVFSWKPGIEISFDVKLIIELKGEMDSALSVIFNKSFPEVPVYQQQGEELKQVNIAEIQASDAMNAGKTIVNIDIYNERAKRIWELTKTKGNLGEIIKLIG